MPAVTSARFWRRFHLWALVLWMGPGAVVSWLAKDSVPWVAFMSLYAIWTGHFGAWQAARAEGETSG